VCITGTDIAGGFGVCAAARAGDERTSAREAPKRQRAPLPEKGFTGIVFVARKSFPPTVVSHGCRFLTVVVAGGYNL